MEFAPIQEFPLHLIAGFESDGRGDGHGEGDVEAGSLSAGSVREQINYQERSRRALRCNLLRTLLNEDFRGFSVQLAGNPLYLSGAE